MQPVVAVLFLALALAAAKPPPATYPGPDAPWAAYVSKPGPLTGRSLVGLGAPLTSEEADDSPSWSGSPMAPMAPMGPMAPFLKLKPFLPMKPTFMPPVVDPSKFIDMKASLLNSLFPGGMPVGPSPVSGAAPAGYSLSARALFSPFAPPGAFTPPAPVTKPPPPAFLADLFKALNINKTVANASDPATAPYPAAAYPGAPAFPAAPFIDPGIFISMKAKFLSDLFAGLATTPAPPPAPAAPDAAVLNAELAASLQRLLDSLTPVAPDVPEDEQSLPSKAKRAANSAALVADAKDKVVETIIAELAEIKNSMVGAVTDLAAAQKAADAAQAAAAVTKKPLSPYAAMWAKPSAATTAKPPLPVEPVRQKVVLLGQVFDMLTDMEKDITSSMVVTPSAEADSTTEGPASPPTFMDAVKAKINQIITQNNVTVPLNTTASEVSPSTPTAAKTAGGKSVRLAGPAPAGPVVDPTFWIPDSVAVGPEAYLAKTKEFLANIMASKSTPSPLVRRSYKPYYQQEPKSAQETPPAQFTKQQQPPQEQQPEKLSSEGFPGVPFAFHPQRHHHHHNRQPYWWN